MRYILLNTSFDCSPYSVQVPDNSEEPAAEETEQKGEEEAGEEVQSEEETWEDKEGRWR